MQLDSAVQRCNKTRDEQREAETNNVLPHLMFSTQLFFNASCQKRTVVIIWDHRLADLHKSVHALKLIHAEKEINAYKLLVELIKL